jgi:peptidoglycan/LPS O-acetylase OafA/YrhL
MLISQQTLDPPVHSERPLKFVHTQASLLLDLLRALAAFIVLSEHWRNIFFVDFSSLGNHKLLFLLPYLFVSGGHQAVVIFFVLSGYLISGSVFRMFQRDRWSWRTYLVHRLLRLWVVLIPGLAITAIADHLGMTLHRPPAVALYAGLSGDHVIGPVTHTAGFFTAAGNFLFLQGVTVAPFGSDGALWSLANEFWYYLLFPLGLIALRRKSAPLTRVVHAVLFLAAAWFVREHILALFPIWLLGTLLCVVPPPRLRAIHRSVAAVLYAALFYSFSRAPQLRGAYADDFLGLATFLFLWILLSAKAQVDQKATATRATRLFARFSYTLYVAHTPLLVLIAALILGDVRWQPDPLHLAAALGILFSVLGICFLLATQTEFRTDRIRSSIERRLHLSV